jgi:hypothetical protein
MLSAEPFSPATVEKRTKRGVFFPTLFKKAALVISLQSASSLALHAQSIKDENKGKNLRDIVSDFELSIGACSLGMHKSSVH